MAGLYADPVPGMSVTADFSDGSSQVTLRDDGVAPDTTANDAVFTASWTPSNVGPVTVTFTASAPSLVSATTTVSGAVASSYRTVSAPFSWTEISTTGTPLELGDDSVATVSPSMSIRFAGQSFTSLTVSANGFISFSNQDAGYSNKPLPVTSLSNLIAVYWDDLIGRPAIDRGVIYWQVVGSAPFRQLVVEWKDFAHYAYPSHPGSVAFQAVFYEHTEDIRLQYQTVVFGNSAYDGGASATVGIQLGSTSSVQYSYNSKNSVADGVSIHFSAGKSLGWLKEAIPDKDRVTPVALDAPPSHFDWRNQDGYNWMTPIRDQASCGSCVAFGAVAVLEGQLRIQANNPSWNIDLSEQHLFSCGGGSCTYGWYLSSALNYLQQNGTPDEACSPYRAQSGSASCANSCSDWRSRAYKINSWNWVAVSPSAIQAALLNGPLLAAFDVYTDFFYYGGGVYRHTWGVYEGGHAIAIVGYDQPGQYWIVKNSWGSDWGESGYFNIAFGEAEIEQSVASATTGPTTRTTTLTSTLRSTSTSYLYRTTTRTVTSFTGTRTLTSTVVSYTTTTATPTVTVAVALTSRSTMYASGTTTATVTSYTSTHTSTVPTTVVTTIIQTPTMVVTVIVTSSSTSQTYPATTVTVTSYTSTYTSTTPTVTTVTVTAAPTETVTHIVTSSSTSLAYEITTTTTTSYTSTHTSLATTAVTTTITDGPTATVTSTVPLWSTEYVTSTHTTTTTSHTSTTTTTSTEYTYMTVTETGGGSGSSTSGFAVEPSALLLAGGLLVVLEASRRDGQSMKGGVANRERRRQA
jgi:C1A family cysteine protease